MYLCAVYSIFKVLGNCFPRLTSKIAKNMHSFQKIISKKFFEPKNAKKRSLILSNQAPPEIDLFNRHIISHKTKNQNPYKALIFSYSFFFSKNYFIIVDFYQKIIAVIDP